MLTEVASFVGATAAEGARGPVISFRGLEVNDRGNEFTTGSALESRRRSARLGLR